MQFGLNSAVPKGVTAAWGARFIYPADMLWDRQSMVGEQVDQDLLKLWLNGGALKAARDAADVADDTRQISADGEQTVILYQDKQGVVVACPNRSYGYLYVAAWLHNGDAEKQPAPEYRALTVPKKKRGGRP